MAMNLDFSIAKAETRLAYRPRVDFRDGMREALDWAMKTRTSLVSPGKG